MGDLSFSFSLRSSKTATIKAHSNDDFGKYCRQEEEAIAHIAANLAVLNKQLVDFD